MDISDWSEVFWIVPQMTIIVLHIGLFRPSCMSTFHLSTFNLIAVLSVLRTTSHIFDVTQSQVNLK